MVLWSWKPETNFLGCLHSKHCLVVIDCLKFQTLPAYTHISPSPQEVTVSGNSFQIVHHAAEYSRCLVQAFSSEKSEPSSKQAQQEVKKIHSNGLTPMKTQSQKARNVHMIPRALPVYV